jgi:ATP/maltotriose-dependent transcriptional regulator MalT
MRMAASGEEAAMRMLHRDYMLRLVEGIVDQAFVRGDPPWPVRVAMYHQIGAERANFNAALAASLENHDAGLGLRLCSGLRSSWVTYGDVAEGIVWFDRFLQLDEEVGSGIRARALIMRAELAFELQDYAVAGECGQAGLELCRASGSPGAAGALRVLAVVSLRAGRHEEALALVDSAVETARADGDDWDEGLALASRAAVIARQGRLQEAQRAFGDALDVLRDNNGWGVAQTLYGLGGLARARGDHQAAVAHFRSALALYREIDARPEIARCLAGIGWVALVQRDLELARSSLAESLQLSLATGQRLAVARGLEAFAMLAVAGGDPARAARLQGAALALQEAVGHVPSGLARSRLEDLLQAARRQLGPPAAEALLAEGTTLRAEQAVRLATGSGIGNLPGDAARLAAPAQAATPLSSTAPSTLTARERQIAALIARGLSNRGIADELVISPATAARHVANIFAKLGFSSRAQVAAWAAQREHGGQG